MAWDVGQTSAGTIVVTGMYQGACPFGEGEANETILEYQGGEMDAYIALYNQDGSLEWALGQGGEGWDRFIDVESFSAGPANPDAFVVSGHFEHTVTFGTGGGDEIELTAAGSEDDSSDLDIVMLRFERDDSGD